MAFSISSALAKSLRLLGWTFLLIIADHIVLTLTTDDLIINTARTAPRLISMQLKTSWTAQIMLQKH